MKLCVWKRVGVVLATLSFGAHGQAQTPAAPAQTPQQQQAAQQAEFFRTHYTKREVHIPMRDGTKLFAAVYAPIAGQFRDKGPYPFLMTRTPYSCAPYGEDKVMPRVTGNQDMLQSGYILVCEDVRGRWASEGAWLEMTPSRDGKGIDESTDTYDTVDWLLKNVPGNNGNVGILGISYPGFYTAASIVDGPVDGRRCIPRRRVHAERKPLVLCGGVCAAA